MAMPVPIELDAVEPTRGRLDLGSAADPMATARRLARSLPDGNRLGFARALCARAAKAFWANRFGDTPMRPGDAPTSTLANDALACAIQLGETVGQLSLDDASYALGSTYAAALPRQMRSKNGVFYTPPDVASALLDGATRSGVNWSTCKVLDPACGGGAFLGPVAARMAEHLEGVEPRIAARAIMARVRGFELDPFAAWLTLVFLDAQLIESLGATDLVSSPVEVMDSLTKVDGAPPGDGFDLVVGNPPYGRAKLSPSQREAFKRSLFGHANLYGLFTDLAVRFASSGGTIALVTPTGFLSGEYFKNLRAVLRSSASPRSVTFVAERSGVFEDVLQETALSIFQKTADSRDSVQVGFLEDGATVTMETAARQLPADIRAPWVIPRSAGLRAAADRVPSLTARLSHYGYRVATGPLVWNRHKSRLRDQFEEGAVPLLWAESVTAAGKFEFRAARRNHSPYFVPSRPDDPNLVSRPCVLLQRTTSKEQRRRLVTAELPAEFIENAGGAVTVENHLNMLVPTVERPAVSPAALSALLNSRGADAVFRCISGTVAVSAYELAAMPLPPVHSLARLERLIRRGSRPERIERECIDAFMKDPE